MSDLISRQAAIDAIDKALSRTFIEPCGEMILKDLPSAQPEHCGDAVSRNAIVQKLNKMDRYVSTELRLCDTDKKFSQNEVFIVDDVYEGIVEQLPSIQPERKTGRWIPSDSELEIKCNKCGKDFSEYVDSIDYIYLAEYPKFCPNCGVKMEGGEQNGRLD